MADKLYVQDLDKEINSRLFHKENGCQLWTGSTKGGKPTVVIYYTKNADGIQRPYWRYVAHLLWEKHHPNEKHTTKKRIIASCGEALCVNPEHLEKHAWQGRPTRSGKPLSDKEVELIRKIYAEGKKDKSMRVTMGELAKQFNCTKGWILKLIHGKARKTDTCNEDI